MQGMGRGQGRRETAQVRVGPGAGHGGGIGGHCTCGASLCGLLVGVAFVLAYNLISVLKLHVQMFHYLNAVHKFFFKYLYYKTSKNYN